MADLAQLYFKRQRGWPWPSESFGMTPMFGEDGWCRVCGVALRKQAGSMVLERRNITVKGGWVPYLFGDTICLESSLALAAAEKFNLDLRPIAWHGASPGDALQIVIPVVGDTWFDHGELRAKAIGKHGSAGARCAECGTWRWLPLGFAPMPPPFGTLPPLRVRPSLGAVDVAASPEVFGDGLMAFRQMLFRRELAEFIAAASPRDFEARTVR